MKSFFTILCIFLSVLPAFGNGVIVVNAQTGACLPLRSSDVQVVVENQVAVTTATMVFLNSTGDSLAPNFAFPLPEGASVTGIEYIVSGDLHRAVIKPSPQDTSLPGGKPNATLQTFLGKTPLYFHMGEQLYADSSLSVEVTYVELLPYRDGNVYYTYPANYSAISTAPLARQSLLLSLSSSRTISSIQLTSHAGAVVTNSGTEATVSYQAMEQQASANYELSYSLSLTELGLFGLSTMLKDSASVADSIDGGYFTFVVEPNPSGTTDVMKKTFTFVVDRSGSMYGEKMTQAKDAATFIVNNLNEGDLFNLVDFDDVVTSFRPAHVPFTAENRDAALAYISSLEARNLTDIAGALDTAIAQFSRATDTTANIIIFLTDGQPTAGTTDMEGILASLAATQTKNENRVSIFVFGIGTDVNVPLLTRIASGNDGLAEFLESDQLESRITSFYQKVRNPVLIQSGVSFTDSGIGEVYPQPVPNLFKGQQLIMAGRYAASDTTTVVFRGTAFGTPVAYQYTLSLSDTAVTRCQFLPKLWAKSKIENLLVRYFAAQSGSRAADSLKAEIIRLSVRYGVATQFTSYVSPGTGYTEVRGGNTTEQTHPRGVILVGNYPNPFNPTTKIRFRVISPLSGIAQLRIYNVLGQLVRTLIVPFRGEGFYEVTWDGRNESGQDVPSGVYLYVLMVREGMHAGKMTLLR